MARINFEDSVFKDDSFAELIIQFKCKTMAIGVLVEIFMLAQKYYLVDGSDRLIPIDVWERFKWHKEVSQTSAVITHENGIYVRGSKEQFAWLVQKTEAGRKGGLKRAENAKNLAQATLAPAKAPLSEINPLTLSLTLPLKKENNIYTHSEEVQKAWEVWSETLEAFKIPRTNMMPNQESSISRGIKLLGFENVLLALEGVRFERAGKDFRPADHLSVDRALHKDRFGKSNAERFKNLALANRSKNTTRRLTEEELTAQAKGEPVNA